MAGIADDVSSSSIAHSVRLRQNDGDLSSPWSRVVRGASSDRPSSPTEVTRGVAKQPEPLDCSPSRSSDSSAARSAENAASDGGDALRQKRSPWNPPSNGLVEVEPVMGADAWPALSEAAKNLAKPSPSGSASIQSVVAATASSPQKPAGNINQFNISASSTRQRVKRSGSGNDRTISVEGSPVKGASSEASLRENTNRSNNSWAHGSRIDGSSPNFQVGNDHQRYHGSGRRGNGGGGAVHNSGNRRDQDRGGFDQRSFSGSRDGYVQHRQISRGMARTFMQPPPLVTQPFIATPARVAPLGSPIGYHEIASPVFYVPQPHEIMGGIPFVPPQAVYFAAPDPHLHMMLAKQIDYYFSPENLCKDTYLRQNMDKEGWVAISLIANFNRIKVLTNDIQFLLDIVRTSSVVEVQGDKIRRRNDWMNWPPLLGPPSPDSNALASRIKNMGLEDKYSTDNSQSSSISASSSPNPTDRSGMLPEIKGSSIPKLEDGSNRKDHDNINGP
ncbi:la-related protein 1C-like [Wolffia australiana]